MRSNERSTHITWGVSRADSIRDALQASGRNEEVVALSGDFNIGPLGNCSPDIRRTWFHENMDCVPSEFAEDAIAAWVYATKNANRPVYWVCRTDAGEHVCFLEFTCRMAGRQFEIVDTADESFEIVEGALPLRSLAMMRPEEIVASGLMKKQRHFTHVEQKAACDAWNVLQNENAPLRVVRADHLVSAALDHFDDALVQHAAESFEDPQRLVGRVLSKLAGRAVPAATGFNGDFLIARVKRLAEDGILELRGAGPSALHFQVRRATQM